MKKIIHVRKRTHSSTLRPKEDLSLSTDGGKIQLPKRASYEKVANHNTDTLKKMLKDLQIESRGGNAQSKKTFTL